MSRIVSRRRMRALPSLVLACCAPEHLLAPQAHQGPEVHPHILTIAQHAPCSVEQLAITSMAPLADLQWRPDQDRHDAVRLPRLDLLTARHDTTIAVQLCPAGAPLHGVIYVADIEGSATPVLVHTTDPTPDSGGAP
jgi:hypothetical protein